MADALPSWYAVARDAALMIAGIVIAIRLVWIGDGNVALIGLAMAFVGVGAYGRALANGSKT